MGWVVGGGGERLFSKERLITLSIVQKDWPGSSIIAYFTPRGEGEVLFPS